MPSTIIVYLVFEIRVFHWTWISLIWLHWLSIKPWGILLSPLSHTGVTCMCCHAWLYTGVLEIGTQMILHTWASFNFHKALITHVALPELMWVLALWAFWYSASKPFKGGVRYNTDINLPLGKKVDKSGYQSGYFHLMDCYQSWYT